MVRCYQKRAMQIAHAKKLGAYHRGNIRIGFAENRDFL